MIHGLGLLLSALLLISSVGCKTTTESDVKLIGGVVAKEGQYPATIGLVVLGSDWITYYCTGTFISRTHILTAAHCLVEAQGMAGHGRKIVLKDRVENKILLYFHGPRFRQSYQSSIKNIYVPKETISFLRKRGDWNAKDIVFASDIAVIEVEPFQAPAIKLATLSSRTVKKGTPFRFGGYGCEQHERIPSTADVANANVRRLKYAQGKVSSVSSLIGYGPKYKGLAQQSACYGDSGGPVYFDPNPDDIETGTTEVIGVNSFISMGGSERSEVNFFIVTTNSKLGEWIKKVLSGSIEPFTPDS